MGLFDSLWPSSGTSDPLSSVDPKVREYLQRESPVKYQTQQAKEAEAAAAAAKAAQESQQSTSSSWNTIAADAAATSSESNQVPRQSLYQDGRYAHLWKGYKPMGEIESETKTDHEKLMDVLEGFKERKHQIGQAALENCAIQQEEWISCMKHGDWEDRLQMCRKQVQRFERCYTMQTRLLKALGYRSEANRPASMEEDIQMHADGLYVRMIAQEEALKEAKEAGKPAPELKDLFPRPAGALEPGVELRKTWDEKLEKLPPEERATEEAALRADFQAKAAVAQDVQKLWDQQAAERQDRIKEGAPTVFDRMMGAFRFK